MVKLNNLKPEVGSKHSSKRVGRGNGSTLGKTCGKGHKGQKARSGGSVKPGFEGGQMPMHRRVPKFGFTSYMASITQEVKLEKLNGLEEDVIDILVLKKHKLVKGKMKRVKIIKGREDLTKKVTLKGLMATKSVEEAIKSQGGEVIA